MTDGEQLSKADLWEEHYTNLHRAYNALRQAFQRRAKDGLTQELIAKRLGVDKALISKRLNGSENLTLKTLSFMASAMECRLVISYTPYEDVEAAKTKAIPQAATRLMSTALGHNSIGQHNTSTASPFLPARMIETEARDEKMRVEKATVALAA